MPCSASTAQRARPGSRCDDRTQFLYFCRATCATHLYKRRGEVGDGRGGGRSGARRAGRRRSGCAGPGTRSRCFERVRRAARDRGRHRDHAQRRARAGRARARRGRCGSGPPRSRPAASGIGAAAPLLTTDHGGRWPRTPAPRWSWSRAGGCTACSLEAVGADVAAHRAAGARAARGRRRGARSTTGARFDAGGRGRRGRAAGCGRHCSRPTPACAAPASTRPGRSPRAARRPARSRRAAGPAHRRAVRLHADGRRHRSTGTRPGRADRLTAPDEPATRLDWLRARRADWHPSVRRPARGHRGRIAMHVVETAQLAAPAAGAGRAAGSRCSATRRTR